jgi:hypothetical protein
VLDQEPLSMDPTTFTKEKLIALYRDLAATPPEVL